MWWPFKKEEKITDPEGQLKVLEKSKALLDERWQKKQMTNEAYLKSAKELNEKIEKCRKIING